MDTPPPDPAPSDITLDDVEGVLEWWRLAGVDCSFADTPQNWLAKPEPKAPSAPAEANTRSPRRAQSRPAATASETAASSPFDASAMPADLTAFQEWFATGSPLAKRSTHPIRRPLGPGGAELMVMIEHPGQGSGDGMLSPVEQRFVDGMLRAMRIEGDAAYLASALPAFEPVPDWAELDEAGMCAMLRRHAALAAPQRLIIFSRALARRLFDGDDAIRKTFDCGALKDARSEKPTPVMVAPSVEELLQSPARRRTFWAAWLDWTRE